MLPYISVVRGAFWQRKEHLDVIVRVFELSIVPRQDIFLCTTESVFSLETRVVEANDDLARGASLVLHFRGSRLSRLFRHL